jgi:hypothetical protein
MITSALADVLLRRESTGNASPTRLDYGASQLARPPLRVVHADASYLLRLAVSVLLRREPRLQLVASYADPGTLLAAVDREQPKVLITE